MKLPELLADFQAALDRWDEVLTGPASPVTRDSAILRFELVFELAWKTVQAIAAEQGLRVNSPREAFQAAFQLGLTDDEEVWVDLIEGRNRAVHTHNQALADRLYAEFPRYRRAVANLRANLKDKTGL